MSMDQDKVYVKLKKHEWPDEKAAKRRKRWTIRVVVLAILLAFTMGWLFGLNNQKQPVLFDQSKYERLDAVIGKLNSVWYYGKDIDQLENWLVNNAIKGMLERSNDPYTDYMTAEEALDFEQSIDMGFVGIGVQFYALDGINVVERVFKNSPAEQSEVMPGDIIFKVDGTEVTDMPTAEIADLVKGEAGTIVTIEFLRGNEAIIKEITRGQVLNSAFGYTIDDVGIIELYQFGSSSHVEIEQYLKDMAVNDIHKLILDLRDNGGGYLEALMNIATFFLDEGDVVIQQIHKDGSIEQGKVKSKKKYENLEKIILLVNENTASASEVLAAAMQELTDTLIVGEQTFGKGSVQITHPFSDGSALKVTSAQWLTPNGQLIQDIGVTPDVEVKRHPVFYHDMSMMESGVKYQYDDVHEQIAYAQKALDFLGYQVDRMDGYASLDTMNMVEQFNLDFDIDALDVLTDVTYQVLHTEVLRRLYTHRNAVDIQLQKALELMRE